MISLSSSRSSIHCFYRSLNSLLSQWFPGCYTFHHCLKFPLTTYRYKYTIGGPPLTYLWSGEFRSVLRRKLRTEHGQRTLKHMYTQSILTSFSTNNNSSTEPWIGSETSWFQDNNLITKPSGPAAFSLNVLHVYMYLLMCRIIYPVLISYETELMNSFRTHSINAISYYLFTKWRVVCLVYIYLAYVDQPVY